MQEPKLNNFGSATLHYTTKYRSEKLAYMECSMMIDCAVRTTHLRYLMVDPLI